MNTDRECPICGGPGIFLGILGNLIWHRCRDCGTEFSVVIRESDAPDPFDGTDENFDHDGGC